MQKLKIFDFGGWWLVLALFLFVEFADKAPAAQKNSPGGVASRGKVLYRSNCFICHYDISDKKKVGPGLKGLYSRGKYADGSKVDDASVWRWIDRGGKNMQGFRNSLSDSEIRDLIAYLKTL